MSCTRTVRLGQSKTKTMDPGDILRARPRDTVHKDLVRLFSTRVVHLLHCKKGD
jgi:hypothetical protein